MGATRMWFYKNIIFFCMYIHIMEESPILMKKLPSLSESDDTRIEEKWDSCNEKYMQNIRQTSIVLSSRHMVACKRYKRKYIILSIPMSILPIVMANLSVFLIDMSPFVTPIVLAVIAILNAMMILFNYSQRSEQHNNYSSKYDDLAKKVESVLIRNRKYRQPFDIILSEISEIKRSIDSSSPLL
jgi:hypothetical protein